VSIIKNVLGTNLKPCCMNPITGFFRDGYCSTSEDDIGAHVVCVEVTEEFLNFSMARGNDLATPVAVYGFSGLKPGDRWCLCALRWVEAYEHGKAPKLVLESTHEKMLEYIDLETLKKFAVSCN
jgi:uncharacterized protein